METGSNPTEAKNGAKNLTEQVAAYQKIWMETFDKLLQSTIALPPNSAPPEVLRQMRGGIFQGLAKSWDEFLRSPQFLEGMKQWVENAVVVRKMTNDFLTRAHHEMQGTARTDIDTIMLTVRHMEQRILDRLEKLEERLGQSSANPKGRAPKAARKPPARPRKRPAPAGRETSNQPKPTL